MADVTMGAAAAPASGKKTKSPFWAGLGFQVLVSMVLGIVVGLLWPDFAVSLKIFGDIFIRLIKAAVGPLVFLTVTVGILGAGDIKKVGKIGLAGIVYFEVVSTFALAFGMIAANLFGIGLGVGNVEASSNAVKGAAAVTKKAAEAHINFTNFFTHMTPDSFVGAFAANELLQVLVLALLFGFGLLSLSAEKRAACERGLQTITAAFFAFINIVMRLAPIGTFGAVTYAVGANGSAMVVSLAYMVVTFWFTIAVFVLIVLGAVSLIFRFSLFDLLMFVKDELVIVLGTASSEPVLPRLLEKLPLYGASKQAVGLILPTGYSFNLDGASIMLSFCIIFMANAYHAPLSWEQQLGVLALMMISTKGIATVAGGPFVVLAAVVTATHIVPLEGLAVIFGVWRFMSMAGSCCNVIGNVVATVAVAKCCGEFDAARRDDEAAASI
ncbi:cation:dicarboxylate symporter family transporter [Rhodovulum sp. PH10]|uniref:cation:dicarboxylate symporter family transporter n=1 Tax=Rhodovulum sp. PH10 TaxID=1187851 RepID=UPI00192CABFF|nr:cation:dicarboxylase symporter family transporter [Rhodovulum sp. PH10]